MFWKQPPPPPPPPPPAYDALAFAADTLAALPRVLLFYAVIVVLHAALPSFKCDGYACDWSGRPLRYRLNGPLILAAMVTAWAMLPLEQQTFAAEKYWPCLCASNALGLLFSTLLLLWTPHEPACRCLTVDQKALRDRAAKGEDVCRTAITPSPTRSAAAHFFFGRSFNPRLMGDVIDLKMLLYAVGACALVWNLLSAAALRECSAALSGAVPGAAGIPTALIVYLIMFGWFVLEYMCLELVHLYTCAWRAVDGLGGPRTAL